MSQQLQQPSELERRYVHQVYTQIAPHFNHSRYKAWPKVRQFLWHLPANSLVADVDIHYVAYQSVCIMLFCVLCCGNGKYCCVTHRLYVIGCDICPELAAIALAKSPNCDICLADNLSLPYRDNCFDALISIAVIHHFATENRRRRAIEEMARIVKPEGKLMIYVWALEQTQRQFCAQDVLVPWHIQPEVKGITHQGSVDSQNGNETDPKRMVRVDQLSVADRVIGGSLGMEPLKDTSNTADISEEEMIVDREIFQILSRSLRMASKEHLVAGVARFSPMLGKKLAHVLGTQTPDILAVETFAAQLTTELMKDGVDEFLLFTAVTKGAANDSYLGNLKKPETNHDSKVDIHNSEPGTPTFYRYYHVFKEGELDCLVSNVHSLKIVQSYYDHANWCVVAEKQ